MALALARHGITRVRPLKGGFAAWKAGGLPIEPAIYPSSTPIT